MRIWGTLPFFEKFWVHSKIETSADLFSCPLLLPPPASHTGVVHLLLMELYWHLSPSWHPSWTHIEFTPSGECSEFRSTESNTSSRSVPGSIFAQPWEPYVLLLITPIFYLATTNLSSSTQLSSSQNVKVSALEYFVFSNWLLSLKFRVGVTCIIWGTSRIIGFWQ